VGGEHRKENAETRSCSVAIRSQDSTTALRQFNGGREECEEGMGGGYLVPSHEINMHKEGQNAVGSGPNGNRKKRWKTESWSQID